MTKKILGIPNYLKSQGSHKLLICEDLQRGQDQLSHLLLTTLLWQCYIFAPDQTVH